jgi:hypothetical protein
MSARRRFILLILLISFLFRSSPAHAQEQQQCPLEIDKIDLTGLGTACGGNATETGVY